MPPARPRADDSRSETSSVVTTQKNGTTLSGSVSKSKKNGTATNGDAFSTLKTAAINGALAVTNLATAGAAETEMPQTDWTSIPISVLHTYRAAYKISTPASYTRPHAELLFNSSNVAKRSPSQVLARRKLKDLKLHRKKLAHTNGVSNPTRSSKGKLKDKDKDGSSEHSSREGRRKQVNGTHLQPLNNGDSIAQSIEPTSPTIASASGSSDSAPSTLLNSSNPEATLIGRQSPNSLATNIRKHFNAQPLHEYETIARFTYVMRQQGYGSASMSSFTTSNNAASSSTSAAPIPRTVTPVRVEGSEGDGSGWIMGSMGRQVRITDSGGGGAFRLRFRPQV